MTEYLPLLLIAIAVMAVILHRMNARHPDKRRQSSSGDSGGTDSHTPYGRNKQTDPDDGGDGDGGGDGGGGD